ncbi:efflux RND transporter periplasmic adaptor subunit [Luteimonas sp. FXH3W]|uniref:Efflux RND transporter periplasmic adaptor subunit n=1 Tax=Aquilutibacter rugosus TaxID=3115820 RepID=A0ABU7UWS2_9GAMM
MTSKNTYIAFSIAILLALLAGFGVARWLDPRSTSQTTPQTETTETADAEGEYEDRHGEESSELKLTAEQVASSKLELSNVTRGGGAAIRLSGRVESMVGARAAVGASTSGRVERVLVAPGTTIRAGSAVATIVSGEGASLRAAADAAAAEADAAQMVYRRDSNLLNQGIVARQEMETSRARALAAAANARAARARVVASGRPDANGRLAITSPFSGVVTQVSITPGGFVQPGDVVANVADPERNELVFAVAPAVASGVKAGMRLAVTASGSTFSAIVTGVAPDTDEATGMTTIRARVESGTLPPSGTIVSAILSIDSDAGALSVPSDAVQSLDGRNVVFVAEKANQFRVVPVTVGRDAGGWVEILSGLRGDEQVVSRNAFLLKAEIAKGEAEEGH